VRFDCARRGKGIERRGSDGRGQREFPGRGGRPQRDRTETGPGGESNRLRSPRIPRKARSQESLSFKRGERKETLCDWRREWVSPTGSITAGSSRTRAASRRSATCSELWRGN